VPLVHHPRRFALEDPDRLAIIWTPEGRTVTYAELEASANRFAQLLRSRGIGIGDHIALLMENEPEYLMLAWGAQRAGVYYTAINRHLRPGEIQYILDDCGAKALVGSAARAETLADLDTSRLAARVTTGGSVPGWERYEDAASSLPPTPIADEAEGKEMLYSSGTTGRPKGIRRPLPGGELGDPCSKATAHVAGYQRRGIGEGAVYLCPAPIYHAAPLVACLNMHRIGATVVLMSRFDAPQFLDCVERYGVTHTEVVPTMFVRLLRLPDDERASADLSTLRNVVHAAAPCPVDVKREMIAWLGPIIDEYYSGTEDIGHAWITSEEWLAHPGSVGRPMVPAHIVGPDGDEAPPGTEGLVYFDGGTPFEYHNDPGKTASVSNGRGWRTLGDIGYLDGDGYLYLTDRQSNMIVAGGVNVYPQETENVLLSHPAVLDVAVVGVPDPDMGEAVKGVVQLADPSGAGEAMASSLQQYCMERLAPFKCPRTIDFVDQLPRDQNGKLYKRLVKERYWEDRRV